MTRKLKIITTSLAGVATLGAGVAFAQTADKPDLTRAAAAEHAATMFERFDVNSDGVIDEGDREARAEQRFERLDADSDGAISPEEFSAVHERRGEMRENRGRRGEMRGEHAEGHRGLRGKRGGMRHMGGRGLIRTADADQDGSVTQAEFTAAMLARFDSADADKNGTISAAERDARREARRERHEQMRQTSDLADEG